MPRAGDNAAEENEIEKSAKSKNQKTETSMTTMYIATLMINDLAPKLLEAKLSRRAAWETGLDFIASCTGLPSRTVVMLSKKTISPDPNISIFEVAGDTYLLEIMELE